MKQQLSDYFRKLGYWLWSVTESWDTCLVSRRLETYLHVSVLAKSWHIHVLSWLESHSSTSRLGSVSWLSWCVLVQRIFRSWHIRFEQYRCWSNLISFLMWHSDCVTVIYVLVGQSVSDYNVCFVRACRSNVKLFWLVSCLDTCVSAESQVSNIFTVSQFRLVSTKS